MTDPTDRSSCPQGDLAPAPNVIVYGRNPVREALRGPRSVARVWATKNTLREPWLQVAGGRVFTVDAAEIERRCGFEAHQGICAEVSEYRYADAGELLAVPNALIVALDQVQDPQNLGAIARSAECSGAAGIVLPERRSAEVTPAVCKASAGAVEHLAIARVRNLSDFLADAKAAGGWCYGAAVTLVLGSEGPGLRPGVAAACDVLVSVPLRGRIRSLSVSAAAAVLLYAAASDRG